MKKHRSASRSRTGNKDANQREIEEALKAIEGCSVVDVSRIGNGVPDLLVGYRGRDFLLEVKRIGEKTSESQSLWMAKWNGFPVGVVCTVEAAKLWIGMPDVKEL